MFQDCLLILHMLIYFIYFGVLVTLTITYLYSLEPEHLLNQINDNWELGMIESIKISNESCSEEIDLFNTKLPGFQCLYICSDDDVNESLNGISYNPQTTVAFNMTVFDTFNYKKCFTKDYIYDRSSNTIDDKYYCIKRSQENYKSLYMSNYLTTIANDTCGVVDSLCNFLCND